MAANGMSSLVAGTLGLRGDSSKFRVEFDDGRYDLGTWARVSGLSVQWDVVEQRSGMTNQIWITPGIAKYSKLSFSRATCPDSQIVQDWLAETSQNPRTFTGRITLTSWSGMPLCEWPLKQFVPIGWKIADFESKAATVVLETLEVAHTGFLRDDVLLPLSATS